VYSKTVGGKHKNEMNLKMILTKLLDKGGLIKFHSTKQEVFIIEFNVLSKHLFYIIDNKNKVKEVDEEYFLLNTIGQHFEKISTKLPSNIHNYIRTFNKKGDSFFSFYQEDTIHRFDSIGNLLDDLAWTRDIGGGHALYDIVFEEPNFIWLAFPTGQTVTKISVSEKKEVFKIGKYSFEENINDIFCYPEGLFIKDSSLVVSNMGNKTLNIIDLGTLEVKISKTFEERIWQYMTTDIGEFVVTDTGLYKIV